MKKLILAVPCIVMGMILGASATSEAGLMGTQSAPVRSNFVVVAPYMDEDSNVYECEPGMGVSSCILDALSSLDDDNTFKLIGGGNAIRCGASPMAAGATCQYNQATFGGPACIDGDCPIVKIDPDQP